MPKLPFDKKELEPYISSETIEFHYEKHHTTYMNNLNKLIIGTEYENQSIEDVIKDSHKNKEMGIFNNAAQFYNHSFYWNCLKINDNNDVGTIILEAIVADFGSFENFTDKFKNAALTQFGSGWAWLVFNRDTNKIEICKTSNADNPLLKNMVPLLTIDVWEHAYYIDYRNRRAEYIDMFIKHLINWSFVEECIKRI